MASISSTIGSKFSIWSFFRTKTMVFLHFCP
jgi:hypothetical protein